MTWDEALIEEKKKPYFSKLSITMKNEYAEKQVFPPSDMVMNAMNLTPLDSVKVVILGQDPYHGDGQAMGLSFSVPKGVKIPPSLKNIYKELHSEYGYDIPNNGDLTDWALQGVLLLNTVLTVRAHEPGSHKNLGWEQYTDAIIKAVEAQDRPIVFMLWGAFARSKKSFITNEKHLVLESMHPSPYSASGFFGNDHFRKCNAFLIDNGMSPIDWRIKDV